MFVLSRSFTHVWAGIRRGLMGSVLLMVCSGAPLWAADEQQAEMMINNVCSTCHKFQGEGESRFYLKAPDLMWSGSKYQRSWFVGFLTGKEKILYAKSYRWDQGWEPDVHITLPEDQAEAIAAYLEKHYIDPRVKIGAFDVSKVTKKEAEFGAQAFKDHACIGCHTIEENGQLVGGPQSPTWPSPGSGMTKIGCSDLG